MSDQPVCLVTGVGPGTGSALVRRFAKGGYRVAMVARDGERLAALADDVEGAVGFVTDVSDLDAVRAMCTKVSTDLGAPSVLVHNAVGGAFGEFDQITPEVLEENFRVNTTALLVLAQQVAPAMVAAGKGCIMATSNTSSLRGKASFAGFAPTKAAQRILCESLARSLGPKGVHVSFIVIDAVIDVPWARHMYSDKPDEYFTKPSGIAEAAFMLSEQDRSAWTFQLDLRPFGEQW